MSLGWMAVIFTPLVAIHVWAIWNAFANGWTSDSLRTYRADTNPIGFPASVAGLFFTAAFCCMVVLHGVGLSPDPVALVKAYVPLMR